MILYKTAIQTKGGPRSFFFDDREELDKFLDENAGKIISTYFSENNKPWEELKKGALNG